MDKISRRDFLKTGAVTGTILTLSGASRGIPQEAPKPAGTPAIRYRELGSTGWKVSEIGFGAMNMRDPELVRAAIDAGINYFDTSSQYMNGQNEEVLGSVISTCRDKVFLTTKLPPESRPDQLAQQMGTSLQRLKTDHVDAILVHGGDVAQMKSQAFIDAFGAMIAKGQARFAGVSVHSNTVAVLDSMIESKFWKVASISYNYTAAQDLTDAIARARKAGIAIVAMKTLNKGRGSASLASETMTVNQGSLRWVLQNKNVDTTVPGMTSFEHIAEDMKVMEMKLTSDDHRELQRYAESMKTIFCSGIMGCTGCLNQCPHGVQVHEINRCLGYAYGYGDIQLARENYYRLPSYARADACSNCGKCKVTCANGLNLDENINRAQLLFT